jgi:hypothetical protein
MVAFWEFAFERAVASLASQEDKFYCAVAQLSVGQEMADNMVAEAQ